MKACFSIFNRPTSTDLAIGAAKVYEMAVKKMGKHNILVAPQLSRLIFSFLFLAKLLLIAFVNFHDYTLVPTSNLCISRDYMSICSHKHKMILWVTKRWKSKKKNAIKTFYSYYYFFWKGSWVEQGNACFSDHFGSGQN